MAKAEKDIVVDNDEDNTAQRNIVIFVAFHLTALYGAWILLTGAAKWQTIIFAIFFYNLAALGITAGAHRLWAHRSYKATQALQIFLIVLNTITFQGPAVQWSQRHRVHHRVHHHDDLNCGNSGFFKSYIGWLLFQTDDDTIDDDLLAEPVLSFQRKFYNVIMPLLSVALPTVLPVWLWNETWTNAWFIVTMFRLTFLLNATWLLNSVAHIKSGKPYENLGKTFADSKVAMSVEGYTNYRNEFPWDYTMTDELAEYRRKAAHAFIDFAAQIGWAYDLKVPKTVGEGEHQKEEWVDADKVKTAAKK